MRVRLWLTLLPATSLVQQLRFHHYHAAGTTVGIVVCSIGHFRITFKAGKRERWKEGKKAKGKVEPKSLESVGMTLNDLLELLHRLRITLV